MNNKILLLENEINQLKSEIDEWNVIDLQNDALFEDIMKKTKINPFRDETYVKYFERIFDYLYDQLPKYCDGKIVYFINDGNIKKGKIVILD